MDDPRYRVDVLYAQKLATLTCARWLRYHPELRDRESYESAANWGVAQAVHYYDPAKGRGWRSWVILVVRHALVREWQTQTGRWTESSCPPQLLPLTDDLQYRYAYGPDAAQTALRRSERARVREHVADLDEKQRRVIVSHFWAGSTWAEIARQQGITREYVRQLRNKAYACLRTAMEAVSD